MQIPVNNLRAGSVFEENGQALKVVKYEHTKVGRGTATIRVKVKNLKTGSTTEKTFISGARVENADVEHKKAQFLYKDEYKFYFMDNTTYEQFELNKDLIGEDAKFLKEGIEVDILIFKEEPLSIELPTFIIYKVETAGPSEKGNSVSNIYKPVILENGLQIQAPLFIKDNDQIKIDTRTSEYVERV